jgi:NADH dehydrogenase
VHVGQERVRAATVLWAAGVKAANLNQTLGVALDRQGRAIVEADLSLPGHPEVFIAGDQCHFAHQSGEPLPGLAPVAMQQGRFVARAILNDLSKRPRGTFHYVDKGQMATIGRSRAVAEMGKIRLGGWLAWMAWLVVHIYYLTGFKNRLFVVLQWMLSYLSYRRGARLIVGKDWHITHREPDRDKGAAANVPDDAGSRSQSTSPS